ncbi:MAG: ABC transporter permease [Candidatus Thorarchaeota archaeon]
MRTTSLVRYEIRMLFNQFRSAITTPSMLLFYGVTFFGIFFVSLVLSSMVRFAPILGQIAPMLESMIDRNMLMTALGIVTASAAYMGYYGIGAAALITDVDESVLMPAPISPHHLFMSRYSRRLVRKVSFILLGVLSVLPLLWSANVLFFSAVLLMVSLVLFLETNYFIGTVASYVRIFVQKHTSSRLHHILPVLLAMVVLIPTIQIVPNRSILALIAPSNAMGIILTESTGLLSEGMGITIGIESLILGFVILFLAAANVTGYDYYEVFTQTRGREETEGRFSKIIHGQVDFSRSRYRDPTMWIILKDFWTRMRSPMQFWKYVYAAVGSAFVIYLNLFHPSWLRPFPIPLSMVYATIPAFLLMLILMIQMASVTSLLSFADERENVYLLKASPFRSWDIVFAKYLLSLVEVAIAAFPLCGFLVYFLRVEGYLPIITLAAPLAILFTATGVAIGAYVPVMTNDPRTLPVPLAFSYPIVNLVLGTAMVLLVANLAEVTFVVLVLPVFTLSMTFLFLLLSVRALDHYK